MIKAFFFNRQDGESLRLAIYNYLQEQVINSPDNLWFAGENHKSPIENYTEQCSAQFAQDFSFIRDLNLSLQEIMTELDNKNLGQCLEEMRSILVAKKILAAQKPN